MLRYSCPAHFRVGPLVWGRMDGWLMHLKILKIYSMLNRMSKIKRILSFEKKIQYDKTVIQLCVCIDTLYNEIISYFIVSLLKNYNIIHRYDLLPFSILFWSIRF